MSFDTLGLSPALLRALADQGYTTPTPIQSQAIPLVLAGRDLVGCAQTGTGKTAGFALPILERLFPGGKRSDGGRRRLRVLVLTPTRELAAQVQESFRDYGKHVGLVSTTVFGGVGMSPQVKALRQGVDVLVATPGRLMDHMQQRTVDLSGIDHLVLDEADRMLDMGFLPAIQRILQSLPKARQTLLFSATFAD
ncbi:MAG TPA: DEAD/DEAH box helicase, partial [Xanthomonadaceae bacterium]|nr:DEAD/DEAH box helicase [Xanthomonadaceae bacterium]